MTVEPDCPYCGAASKLTDGLSLYGDKALAHRLFYWCQPCGAWVGTTRDGEPLGTLADKGLRALRREVVAAIGGNRRTRELLERALGLPGGAKVATFDAPTCARALRWLRTGS